MPDFKRSTYAKIIFMCFLFLGLCQGYSKYVTQQFLIDPVATGATKVYGEITTKNPFLGKLNLDNSTKTSGIALLIATYARNNNSSLEIKLTDESGSLIIKKIINSGDIKDNSYYQVLFPNDYKLNSKIVNVSITSLNAVPGNAVTVYLNSKNQIVYGLPVEHNKYLPLVLIILALFCFLFESPKILPCCFSTVFSILSRRSIFFVLNLSKSSILFFRCE